MSAPLTVVVDRFATDAERDSLLAAVKSGGTAAAEVREAQEEETLQLGSQRVAVKYAYARNAGSGRLITVIAAQTIGSAGARETETRLRPWTCAAGTHRFRAGSR